MRKCSIDGCERTKAAKGYCGMHYMRIKRYSDSEIINKPGLPPKYIECIISDCTNKPKAHGLCPKHYERKRKHGNSLTVLPKSKPPLTKSKYKSANEMFLDRFVALSKNDCWEWEGFKTKEGYGRFEWKGKRYNAARFSYEYYLGKFDENLFVCHKCDNPPCINPEHLFLGTHKENMHDRDVKKRNFIPTGEKNPKAILNEDNVIEIRKLLDSGHSLNELSALFKVSKDAIHNIKTKKTWGHIK